MHFSKASRSRSICINGDWDNAVYEMTIQEGESLTKAEEAIDLKLTEWENRVRTQRNPPEQSFTKATDLVKKDNMEEQFLKSVGEVTDIKELEKVWKKICDNPKYPNLKKAYEEKFSELSK